MLTTEQANKVIDALEVASIGIGIIMHTTKDENTKDKAHELLKKISKTLE